MTVLIKNARIINSSSKYNNQTADVLIENGKIKAIDKELKSNATKELKSKNLHISSGWVDLHAYLGEPGFEDRETIESGLKAAAAGGFTIVCSNPETLPVCDNKSVIEFLKKSASSAVCELLPVGAVSTGNTGEDMAEIFDMHQAGAAYFSSGKKCIQNADLLRRLLIYSKQFDTFITQFPQDSNLSYKGVMNEGVVSTANGLRGIPILAEDVIVKRDIEILNYSEGKLHFGFISSPAAVEEIHRAKKKLSLSNHVSINSLAFNDEKLIDFDSNFKFWPPLRDEKSRKKLIAQVLNNKIDCISADHSPRTYEEKVCEFEHAKFGSLGFQVFYPVYNQFLSNEIPLSVFIEKITDAPRKLLKLPIPKFDIGEEVDFTLFDPTMDYTLNAENNHSITSNNAFFNKNLKGKVLAVFKGKRSLLNE